MPKGKVKDALRLWYTADTVARRGIDNMVIPPLRMVNREDFADKKNRRRFSQDIKPLVGSLEKLLAYDPEISKHYYAKRVEQTEEPIAHSVSVRQTVGDDNPATPSCHQKRFPQIETCGHVYGLRTQAPS